MALKSSDISAVILEYFRICDAGPLPPAIIARRLHSFGMVAASSGGSNVPPDHPQAAPVLGFVRCSADEFGVRPCAGRRDSEPGEPRQHEASRTQPRGLPAAVAALPLDGPSRRNAQCPAVGIAAPERQPFGAAKTGPGHGGSAFQDGGYGQEGRAGETGEEQQGAAQQDEAAQARIRRDLGRV